MSGTWEPTFDLDAGADASVDGGDAGTLDADTLDADILDADTLDAADGSELPDADTEVDASQTDFDSGIDADVDGGDERDGGDSNDSSVDAGDAGPVLSQGVGPVFSDPAVEIAFPPDVSDALFTATIVTPVSRLVLVNVEQDGMPYFDGMYYTFWMTGGLVPDAVPVINGQSTGYVIHTSLAGETAPFDVLAVGATASVALDMYVSFPSEERPRTPYHRLYVFGADDELTQIVDFEAQP